MLLIKLTISGRDIYCALNVYVVPHISFKVQQDYVPSSGQGMVNMQCVSLQHLSSI